MTRHGTTYQSLRIVFRASPGLASLLVLSSVVVAALTPFIAVTAMRVADAILAGSSAGAVRWVLVELAFVIGIAIAGRLRMDVRTLLRGRVGLETRLLVAHKVCDLELTQLEDGSTQDSLAAARTAAEGRPLDLVSELLTIGQSVLTLLIYAVILSRFSAWALLLLVAALPGAIAEVWSSRIASRGRLRRLRRGRRLRYLQDLVFSETHAAENHFLGIGPDVSQRSRELGQGLFADERSDWRRSATAVLTCQVLPPIVLNACYLYIAIATVQGHMTVGVLMLYGVSLNSAQRLSQTLLTLGRRAVGSWQEAHELLAFLDTPPRLLPAAPGHAERGRASRSAEGLRLENISFRYPGTDAWAIRNLDIRIAPGEFVAVTGGNGSGKSTLLKLVTGLYSPTEGTIRLDGVDLASMDAPQARSRFAIVFQDFARYGLTVRENVVMGQPNFDADGAAVDAALRASCADDMVARLPDGMETELLPGLENGVDLSGGQWQRIALARGMVRDNADFLVLDEPTAALDAEAERRVFEHLRQLRGRVGVILVTHRLPVLDAADQVIELRHGQPLARRRPARARATPQLRGPGRAARSRLVPSASAPAPRAIRTPRSPRR